MDLEFLATKWPFCGATHVTNHMLAHSITNVNMMSSCWMEADRLLTRHMRDASSQGHTDDVAAD